MAKKHRPPPSPPRAPSLSAPSASAGDLGHNTPALPPSSDSLHDLLAQFAKVADRIGDELSPGRVAVAVERQLGLSPSVIQDAVDAHRGLR